MNSDTGNNITLYTHIPPGETVESISGRYVIEKEIRVPFEGRDALVVIGYMIIDNSCCGTGGCRYALVPGLIAGESAQSPGGGFQTPVEPVDDDLRRDAISGIISAIETVGQVIFL